LKPLFCAYPGVNAACAFLRAERPSRESGALLTILKAQLLVLTK
jgi:hypothetical protein